MTMTVKSTFHFSDHLDADDFYQSSALDGRAGGQCARLKSCRHGPL